MLRGAHSRRAGIDVERQAGQRVGVTGQAHRWGATDLHRVGEDAYAGSAGNGRNR
jgi:hypothetical protein